MNISGIDNLFNSQSVSVFKDNGAESQSTKAKTEQTNSFLDGNLSVDDEGEFIGANPDEKLTLAEALGNNKSMPLKKNIAQTNQTDATKIVYTLSAAALPMMEELGFSEEFLTSLFEIIPDKNSQRWNAKYPYTAVLNTGEGVFSTPNGSQINYTESFDLHMQDAAGNDTVIHLLITEDGQVIDTRFPNDSTPIDEYSLS